MHFWGSDGAPSVLLTNTQAYSPLIRAQRMDDPRLIRLAKKYSKSPAQVLLRWSLQKVAIRHSHAPLVQTCVADEFQGFVPLPKSVTHSRIEENIKLYDFELSDEDMESLATGDYAPCSWDPTTSRD